MGNDLKCIIIDFFGLPGCGKSTISHLLAEKIDYKKVFEPSYISDHYWTVRKRTSVKAMRAIYIALRYNKIFRKIISLIKANEIEGIHTIACEIINITDKIYSIIKKRKDNCYIVFDEGIAQIAISLSLNQKKGASENYYELLKVIELESEKILLVYLEEDTSTALMRMEKRTSNDSRVEKTNDLELKNTIMQGFLHGAEELKLQANIWVKKGNNNKIDFLYDYVHNFEQKEKYS